MFCKFCGSNMEDNTDICPECKRDQNSGRIADIPDESAYEHTYAPKKTDKNSLRTAAICLAVISAFLSIACCFIPYVGPALAILTAIGGIICSVFVIKNEGVGSAAVIGIAVSAIAIVISISVILMTYVISNSYDEQDIREYAEEFFGSESVINDAENV